MTQSDLNQQGIRGTIVFVFALALAVYVAWLLRQVLALCYVSALFAVVLSPVVHATARVQVGRWRPFQGAVAILVLLLALAAALSAFGFLALPPVIRDLQSLNGEMPARGAELLAKIMQIPFADRLDPADVIAWLQKSLSSGAESVLHLLTNWAGAIARIVAGFVLTLYFILEGNTAYRWFLSFLSVKASRRLDETLQRAAIRMQRWLLGQLTLMLILGVVSTAVYLAVGIRYAYALGVLTGLLNLIPVLGAMVSLVLAMLIGAIDSWGRVLGVAIFFAVYLQIENTWLIPRIMRNRVNLPALAIFVALLLGSALEGILGAMVAIPTAVLVSVLLDEYLVRREEA